MKTLIYIVGIKIFLLFSHSVFAQQTYVPDDNFESYLELNFLGNGIANDNYVNTSAISSLISLNLIGEGISDLTGIEDFTSLETLWAGSNQLTSIDVSANTALKDLRLLNNTSLTALDVSTLTSLEFLSISNTAITHLDLTNNTALETVYGRDTPLVFLDLKNGNNTNISTISLTGSTDLTYVNVDDANYSTTNWTFVEPTTTFHENSYLNIPDDNFEMYLETHDANGNVVPIGDPTSLGNGIMDDYVNIPDIESLTTLDISGQNISDLTGLGAFAGLETLNLSNNNLTSIDVSSNTSLTSLDVSENSITSLDLDLLTSLEVLNANSTSLNSIDLSNNTSLTCVDVSGSLMTNLDVSMLTLLEKLDVSDGAITHLDLTNNAALTEFYGDNGVLEFLDLKNGNNTSITSIDISNNPNLTSVNVDDEAYSAANWTNVDPSTAYSEHAYETYVPDDAFENYLETHNSSGNVVAIGNANSMGNGIANDNYVLTSRISAVTLLDVSIPPSEEESRFNETPISDLTGVEDFTALRDLYCQDNSLTSLNVDSNLNLENLNCGNNSLTTLKVDLNTQLESLDIEGNTITNIDLSNNTNLHSLVVANNSLTELELSNNSQLVSVRCTDNNLTSLNLSNNTLLETVHCSNNSIVSLDLSANSVLTRLSAGNNGMETLNIKNINYSNLSIFNVTGNNLTCIEADTTNSGGFGHYQVDPGVSLGLDCSGVNVPVKVILHGAMTNPNSGEEHLMRDDLRSQGLIPTTSPYADAITCAASVFNTTGDNAIVDWVYVELRDTGNTSTVIEGQSALLQRDGDVVQTDGTSILNFTSLTNDYYISVSHRNHLSIITATSLSISSATNSIDISDSTANVLGGSNALIDLGNSIYAMYGGNYDGNEQLQNTDISGIQSLLGNSGYFTADFDMNGQIQVSELNNILRPNIGKGRQY